MALSASKIGIIAGVAFVAWTVAATGLVLLPKALAPAPVKVADAGNDAAFGARVKDYLVANPEIMLEVQDALEKKYREAQAQKASAALKDNKTALFQSEHDIALGNPEGDVTIVEFFDYNCGYCRKALADMDKIIASDKNVRFVLKEWPILGPDSEATHVVSDAFRKIAPEKYGEFHRALMGSQNRATEESALEAAEALGVSEAEIRAMMVAKPATQAFAEANQLALSLGFTGTPAYVVGDQPLGGAVGSQAIGEMVANIRGCGKTTC